MTEWTWEESEKLFECLMIDNYDRVADLVDKIFDIGAAKFDERVGYLYAWLESFIKSDYFVCGMTDEELEDADLWEVTRMILRDELL